MKLSVNHVLPMRCAKCGVYPAPVGNPQVLVRSMSYDMGYATIRTAVFKVCAKCANQIAVYEPAPIHIHPSEFHVCMKLRNETPEYEARKVAFAVQSYKARETEAGFPRERWKHARSIQKVSATMRFACDQCGEEFNTTGEVRFFSHRYVPIGE